MIYLKATDKIIRNIVSRLTILIGILSVIYL